MNFSEKSRIEELQNQNQQLMTSLDSANAKNRALLQKTEEMSQNLLEKDRKIESIFIEFSSKPSNFGEISEKDRIKELMVDLENSRKKTMELEEKLLTKDSKLTELSLLAIEIERLNTTIKQKDQTIARIIQELQASNQDFLELQSKSTKFGVSFEENFKGLRGENEKLRRIIGEKDQEIRQIQEGFNEEFKKLKIGFSGTQEGLSGKISEISENMQDLRILKETLGFEKSQLLEKIMKYEEKVVVLSTEIERLKKVLHEKDQGFQ